jgi:hypothetical protein
MRVKYTVTASPVLKKEILEIKHRIILTRIENIILLISEK